MSLVRTSNLSLTREEDCCFSCECLPLGHFTHHSIWVGMSTCFMAAIKWASGAAVW